jgi:cell division protein FtsL
MSPETKVVKGGFRATLALIISIIALLLAVAAFNRAGGNLDMNHQIAELKTKIENLKQDTSKQLNNVQQETGKAIQDLGKRLEGGQKNQSQ